MDKVYEEIYSSEEWSLIKSMFEGRKSEMRPMFVQVSSLQDYVGYYEITVQSRRQIYPGNILKFKYRGKWLKTKVLEVGQSILVKEVITND